MKQTAGAINVWVKETVPEWEGWALQDCSLSRRPGSSPAGPGHRLGQPPSADHRAPHWPAAHPHTHFLLWELPQRTEPALPWTHRLEPGSEPEENTGKCYVIIKLSTFYGWIQLSGLHCPCRLAEFAGAFAGSLQVLRAFQTLISSRPQWASSGLSGNLQRIC